MRATGCASGWPRGRSRRRPGSAFSAFRSSVCTRSWRSWASRHQPALHSILQQIPQLHRAEAVPQAGSLGAEDADVVVGQPVAHAASWMLPEDGLAVAEGGAAEIGLRLRGGGEQRLHTLADHGGMDRIGQLRGFGAGAAHAAQGGGRAALEREMEMAAETGVGPQAEEPFVEIPGRDGGQAQARGATFAEEITGEMEETAAFPAPGGDLDA